MALFEDFEGRIPQVNKALKTIFFKSLIHLKILKAAFLR